jgi:hypothetical protein
MVHQNTRRSLVSANRSALLWTIGLLILIVGICSFVPISIFYWEWKGPHKSLTQVVDLDGDGDLDVVIGHTRWEEVSISWAGIIRWINQGDGQFELLIDQEDFGGYAAGAGDVDNDGDPDLLIQTFDNPRLFVNQGEAQGGQSGAFQPNNQIGPPFPDRRKGHTDMGGSVTMGDLNGDGKVDVFVAGCCYGMNSSNSSADSLYNPSISWAWINEWDPRGWLSGHTISLNELDSLPIRGIALGDLDGDGDLDVFAAVGKPTSGIVDSVDDRILLNDGSGHLSLLDQSLGDTDSTSVALGDVNGDGNLDALVGTTEGTHLWIHHDEVQKTGDGAMFAPSEQAFGDGKTKGVYLADLDGDGDLDALIAGIRRAEVWWNDGQARFTRSDQRLRYAERDGIAIADFDGDGDLDIFAGADAQSHHVWFNQGEGKFREASS